MSAAVGRLRALPTWWIPLVALAILALAPVLGVDDVSLRQLVLIATLALIVSGFNLAFGYGGELAVGQVAMYAVGAYVGGILLIHGYDLLVALLVAMAAAAALGVVTAVPGLRLGGWGLAMASFFLILLIPDVTQIFQGFTGGLVGLTGIPIPRLFGQRLDFHGFYLAVLGVCAIWFLFMRNLVVSRHGNALLVLRQSPVLAGSLGIDAFRLKLSAYALGAVPAGLAGVLLVARDRFVAPEYFTLSAAIAVIAASILVGSQTVYGAILGAAILIIGTSASPAFQQYAYVGYGVILLLGILFSRAVARAGRMATQGIDRRLPPRRAAPPVAGAERAEYRLPGASLKFEGITKRFSGLTALDHVHWTARPGQVTGLIGANGSGKTTCLNVITGFYRADHGRVLVEGASVTGFRPHRIARLGIARTFQTPLIPERLTTLEVVASGRYAKDRVGMVATVLRLPAFRRVRARDLAEAHRVIHLLGLDDLAHRQASDLPLGSRRLVEVARALASEPAILLLDEPASGLDEDEVQRLVAVIDRVRAAGATVVLIEHNFAMVCDVADHIYALDFGVVIAEGRADEIRRNDRVIQSYLGSRRDPAGPVPLEEAAR